VGPALTGVQVVSAWKVPSGSPGSWGMAVSVRRHHDTFAGSVWCENSLGASGVLVPRGEDGQRRGREEEVLSG
jgi:hypothetical protein